MLTRQEIEEWHDPPCRDQAEWLLKLADGAIGKEEMDLSIMLTEDLSSPDFLRKKAEECLALSYQINDPKKQISILRLANCWMRLAEHYLTKKSDHGARRSSRA
jgi:hypothetical protein